MIEYQDHLDFYTKKYWFSTSSDLVPFKNWGNQILAEKYLQKYWLEENEYKSVWKPKQEKVFTQNLGLPELMFKPTFNMLAIIGGCLFLREDFEQLQRAMKNIGDTHFVVIQNTQGFTDCEPMFRMKFPVDITWEELTSGNYISAVLFEMMYNEYFVFGTSAEWGKYSASDYENPLDIIGFNPKYFSIFTEQFKQEQLEKDQIQEWLPPKYKVFIK